MGAGLAWLDYDGDGWLDLYLVQSGPFPPDGSAAAANRLFRGRGPDAAGRVSFEPVANDGGAGGREYGQGVVAADVEGDGDVDLLVTNFGRDALLLNDGGGRFAPSGGGERARPPPRLELLGRLRRRRRRRRPRPLRRPLRRVRPGAAALLRRRQERSPRVL